MAGWHAGKGGTDRGRQGAAEALRGLRREDVLGRLRQLHRDCEDYMRPEIEWVAKYMNLYLRNEEPNQVLEDTARKLADPEH